MVSSFASLFKDTAIYGISTILGRLLNWLLTFVYVRVLIPEVFGQMTDFYAWIVLLLIVLTYGMETAFFRYANKEDDPRSVFGTALRTLGFTSLTFFTLAAVSLQPLAQVLGYGAHSELLLIIAGIISLDAFLSLPLAYLRYAQRPWMFLVARMGFVLLTILLTLFVFFALPYLGEHFSVCSGWYSPQYALHYILGINLVGCVYQLVLLLPTIRQACGRMDWGMLRRMLAYGLPILLLGLVGSFNNQADKILFPRLFSDAEQGYTQLGIYSACYKIGIVMILFTQAFRYAYDPYVFARSRQGEEEAKPAYALAMRYYYLFTLVVFVGVMSFLELFKYAIAPAYYEGLVVVPWIMAGQMLVGIYFNLSLWYKLTDRTWWGALLSLVGCALTVLIIYVYAPVYGYMACAWASVISNGAIVLCSYLLGQYYYPVRYPLVAMLGYLVLTAGVLVSQHYMAQLLGSASWMSLAYNALSALLYVVYILWREVPASAWLGLRRRLPF